VETTSLSQSTVTTTDGGGLRRVIGPRLLLLFIVGDVLGTGIYALVGEVAGGVGGAVWSAFAVALGLAFVTAFAYAELVTKYPQAAGAALYVNKAFKTPFVTFMVAFAVMASGVTSAATAARAFGGDYLSEFVTWPTTIVGCAFILVLAAINFRGISESVKSNVLMTLIELAGLVLIIVIGVGALAAGEGDPGRALEFKPGTTPLLAVLGGAALAFYALIGFEDSVNVAEEARDPSKIFPKALFGGLAIASVIYLFVTFTASMVVPTETLADSSGPLLEVVRLGPLSVPTEVFAPIALVAITNTALLNMIMASRLLYGMGNQGIIPRVFASVHSGRRTPWVAIIVTSVAGIALVLTGDLEKLADTTVVLLLLVFILVNISALVLKRDRVEHDHFHAPRAMPVLGALVSGLLLTQHELEAFARAGFLLLVGMFLWIVNRLFHGH
jgi:amino acid transporter